MKLFDKFLKILKTDRNTFATYILLMVTIYLIVDRVFEVLLILTNGVAYHYFEPQVYGFAFLAPIFCFLFSFSSSFIKSDGDKHKWFYAYCIELYILAVCMLIEWINKMAWFGILQLPNFNNFVIDFSYLIRPAFSSVAIAIPLATWIYLFNFLYRSVSQTKLMLDSIEDYNGIDLSDSSRGWGDYTDEIYIGIRKDNGKKVKLCETRRFEHTLVCGITGSGKTTLIFEPWIAQDISKKSFYAQTSKAVAFAGLRTGICTLKYPYSNDYLNKNFSLNMISPSESKKSIFNNRVSELIYAEAGNKVIYRNLGLSYIAADNESFKKISKVCDAFSVAYNIIDPLDPNSIGLNPFAYASPSKAASCIVTILKGLFPTDLSNQYEAYSQNLMLQSITNLSIMLSVVYPKINNGKLPTLVDLMKVMSNFDLVESLSGVLESNEELSEKYSAEISFFRNNFYKGSPNRNEMQRLIQVPIGVIQNLVRNPNVRAVLCNRVNNLNFDQALEEGQVNLVLTRRGELGESTHKALGLFFLLLMKPSVLSRPGSEKTRIPHYLYIDEAPTFLTSATETIFTVYRKYKVGAIISSQSIAQIKACGDKLGETVIANCANKIVFGNNTPAENEFWEKELSTKKEWDIGKRGYNTDKMEYESKITPEYGNKAAVSAGKIKDLKFKAAAFRIKNLKGKNDNGQIKLDFLPAKYLQKQNIKSYDFASFSNGIAESDDGAINSNYKKDDNFNSEEGPIKMNTSKLNFNFNSSDAIINKKANNSSSKK